MTNLSFDQSMVNAVTLDREIRREADGIAKNNTEYRSYQKIYDTVKKSMVAERYMIEKRGYKNNPKKYHDIIARNGTEVEVKVLEERYCNDYFIFEDPYDKNMNQWMNDKYNDAKYVLIFSKLGTKYTLYGCYSLVNGSKINI